MEWLAKRKIKIKIKIKKETLRNRSAATNAAEDGCKKPPSESIQHNDGNSTS